MKFAILIIALAATLIFSSFGCEKTPIHVVPEVQQDSLFNVEMYDSIQVMMGRIYRLELKADKQQHLPPKPVVINPYHGYNNIEYYIDQ